MSWFFSGFSNFFFVFCTFYSGILQGEDFQKIPSKYPLTPPKSSPCRFSMFWTLFLVRFLNRFLARFLVGFLVSLLYRCCYTLGSWGGCWCNLSIWRRLDTPPSVLLTLKGKNLATIHDNWEGVCHILIHFVNLLKLHLGVLLRYPWWVKILNLGAFFLHVYGVPYRQHSL